MIKLRKLENASDLKMGMTILSVDWDGNESFETIDCIDHVEGVGLVVYTASVLTPNDGGYDMPLATFLDEYEVYAVEAGEER